MYPGSEYDAIHGPVWADLNGARGRRHWIFPDLNQAFSGCDWGVRSPSRPGWARGEGDHCKGCPGTVRVGTSRGRPPPPSHGPAAPVNKAKASRALAALLVGFAREFLPGQKGAAEPSSGTGDRNIGNLYSREATVLEADGQRARGVPSAPPRAPWARDGAAEPSLGEPLGIAESGGDRVRAQQIREELRHAGAEKSKREARALTAGERGTGDAQERPGERASALERGGQRGAGECRGERAGVERSCCPGEGMLKKP